MKKNWYRGLSLAEDAFIAEAHPDRRIRPSRRRRMLALVAACACFALLLSGLCLFIPYSTTPPDVSRYADSEYYGLIQKLNTLAFERPMYKNPAAKLWSTVEVKLFADQNEKKDDAVYGEATEDGATGNGYKEVTDLQVKGVNEADRIKRSREHVYYLDDRELCIYTIDKEDSAKVGSYTFGQGSETMTVADTQQWEFYLSEDCKTVTVVTQYYEKSLSGLGCTVKLMSLDVSDPADITVKQEFSITGRYISSRVTNGSILLLTEFVINRQEMDFDDETTFVPQIDEGNGPHSLPAEGIVSPETLGNTRYTVVMKLDEDTLSLQGTMAYLSYTDNVYVSEDHVFLTRVFADRKENQDGSITSDWMTELSCLAYGGDSFEIKGTATIRGRVKDQWSMDEFEGVLRVFTTTNAMTVGEKVVYGNGSVSAALFTNTGGASNASLYCIDLATFETVASVIDFAPPGEEIQSVRFDKELAYVCTSVGLSDPVFFFDLSDLSSITYKDTGRIEGFSTSLINLGNGYLLGIGRESWRTLKVEVYEETKDGVRSVDAYVLDGAGYSTKYKSYYVDRQDQLLGFGVVYEGTTRYILLQFDGYELKELVHTELDGMPSTMRGVFVEGYMYMFGEGDFKVVEVFG